MAHALDRLRIEIPNYFKKIPQAISVLLLLFDFSKMAKVKLNSGAIKSFHGDGDVVAWLQKVQLVARLQKIDDVVNLLPLYLEGNALQLYLKMDEDQQTNIDLMESRLKEARS